MTHLAPDDSVRLEQLRATDTTGIYASDESTTAACTDGSLDLTVDPLLRIVGVRVHRAETVRDNSTLSAALSGAYAAALAARMGPKGDAHPNPQRPRPVARRVRRVSVRPTPEMLDRHQVRYQSPLQGRVRRARTVTGSSDNGCVSVTIAFGGHRGVVHADPGWLAQTTALRLGGAITEAFLDAHSRQGDQA